MPNIAERLQSLWSSNRWQDLIAAGEEWLASPAPGEDWATTAVHYWMARALEKMERYGEALHHVEMANRAYGSAVPVDRPAILVVAAMIHARRMELSEAERVLAEYFATNPDPTSETYAMARYAAGYAAAYRGHPAEAIRHYREAVNALTTILKNPQLADHAHPRRRYFVSMLIVVSSNCAYEAVRAGDWKEARRAAKRAMKWIETPDEPKRTNAYFAQALVALADGRAEAAEALCRSGLSALDEPDASLPGQGRHSSELLRGWLLLTLAHSLGAQQLLVEARAVAAQARLHALHWCDEALLHEVDKALTALDPQTRRRAVPDRDG